MGTTSVPPPAPPNARPRSQLLQILFQPAAVLLFLLVFSFFPVVTAADAQANLLNAGCSPYNITGPSLPFFVANVNASFTDIRRRILQASADANSNASSSSNPHFATAEYPRNSTPVYALFQCRDYLSPPDCLACFDAAADRIRRNCSAGNGARVIYDGCLLRYESRAFYNQAALGAGSEGKCDPRTVSGAPGFAEAAEKLIVDLAVAVPRTHGFFAAAAAAAAGNETSAGSLNNSSSALVFGVAQCVRTTAPASCAECLKVALDNIRRCPPSEEARATDAGCFMRYSAKPFFPLNQTVDLAPFLVVDDKGSGSKSNKAAVIGGAGGGAAGTLLLVAVLLFLWVRKSRRSSKGRRGDILGATELQGPLNFHFKDLKNATRGFSEQNKLGEGGFGDVYKGVLKNGKIVAVKKQSVHQVEHK